MRTGIVLFATFAVVAIGLLSPAKAQVNEEQDSTVSFSDRWAPVDEAQRSGRFAVKDSHDRY